MLKDLLNIFINVLMVISMIAAFAVAGFIAAMPVVLAVSMHWAYIFIFPVSMTIGIYIIRTYLLSDFVCDRIDGWSGL